METNNPPAIGAFPNGSTGLDGCIDEVAIFRRVLSPDERTYAGLGTSYFYDGSAHAVPGGQGLGGDEDPRRAELIY